MHIYIYIYENITFHICECFCAYGLCGRKYGPGSHPWPKAKAFAAAARSQAAARTHGPAGARAHIPGSNF